MIKTLQKMGTEGTYLNRVKAIYGKPTANIILSGKKLKVFPLRSGARQGCSFSPLLFNIVLEVLATATREKEKEPRLEKKKQNSHCLQMTLPYIENPKETISKLLELISELSKVVGYEVNT